jgi:hypothetical protein
VSFLRHSLFPQGGFGGLRPLRGLFRGNPEGVREGLSSVRLCGILCFLRGRQNLLFSFCVGAPSSHAMAPRASRTRRLPPSGRKQPPETAHLGHSSGSTTGGGAPPPLLPLQSGPRTPGAGRKPRRLRTSGGGLRRRRCISRAMRSVFGGRCPPCPPLVAPANFLHCHF